MASRRGRKRKLDAKRYPNGQVVHGNIFEVVQNQPHRKKYGDEFKDQMAECELGRLLMEKIITPVQYDAGVRWREIVAGMRRALGCTQGTARSSAGIMTETSGRVIDMDVIDPERAEERANRARSEYAAAFRALNEARNPLGGLWREPLLAVNDVAIWDKARFEARGGLLALIAALDLLIRHLGLSGRRGTRA